MRYWPVPSVTAVRTFSISTSLDASTVTPGSTAPEVSLTTPVMDAWANAATGNKTVDATTITPCESTHTRPPCLERCS